MQNTARLDRSTIYEKLMVIQPIAAYMKQYRVQRTTRLLRESSDSIAEIASLVGYESQGKFTQAFKGIMDILPTEYRKLYLRQAK